MCRSPCPVRFPSPEAGDDRHHIVARQYPAFDARRGVFLLRIAWVDPLAHLLQHPLRLLARLVVGEDTIVPDGELDLFPLHPPHHHEHALPRGGDAQSISRNRFASVHLISGGGRLHFIYERPFFGYSKLRLEDF